VAGSQPISARIPLIGFAMLSLLAALWAGLLRLGFGIPELQQNLSLAHGPLMVCGFLGTLISLEWAVGLGSRAAFLAPLLSGAGAIALIVGAPVAIGASLITIGSLALVGDFVAIVYRQTALFTIVMALGAVAWLIGNSLWMADVAIPQMVQWWAAFLVLTIVGERLELSRIVRPSPGARILFALSCAVYVAGLCASLLSITAGLEIIGAGMIGLGLWLACYDIARRTIRQQGLTGFIATNLLLGYAWLGLSGIFWLLFAPLLSPFGYDAMLHGLFLGFVFSMIFAHAPIIFPAVLGSPLTFRRSFYFHVALLHVSLLIRISGDLSDNYWLYKYGGLLNVAALLVFVMNTGLAVVSGLRGAEPAEDAVIQSTAEIARSA
jgi:hypothetical protein